MGGRTGSFKEIPPLSQVLLVFLQSSLDVARTLHLNEGLASWKTTVVQTEIDPCVSFDDLGLNKSLVHIITIRATVDVAVLEESAEVNGAGVVGQASHLDDGGVVFHRVRHAWLGLLLEVGSQYIVLSFD